MKDYNIQSHDNGLTARKFLVLPSSRKLPRVFPVLAAVFVLATTGVPAAEYPFFLADFDQGATDGNPVTWVPGFMSAAGSTGSVDNGSYVLTTSGPSSVMAKEFASIGDVSIRTVARGLTVGSGVYIALISHLQPDGRCHYGIITPFGLHTGSGLPGSSSIIGTLFQPGTFDPFTGDVNIQLDVVGTQLSLTAWRVDSRKPRQPQLISTAPNLPPGRVGFGTDFQQIAIRRFDAIRIGDSMPPALGHERVGGNVLRFTIPAGYVLQSNPTLDSPQWSDVGATGSVDVTASDLARFFRLRSQGSLASGDVLTVRQTWSQEPAGYDRSAHVLVPPGEGPFPVVIMLHGMGEDAGSVFSIGDLAPRFNNVIRVAPNGYLKSWNVDAEASKAPDVAFIRDLINLLKTYDNVDAGRISMFGLSNGSALVNRLLIELDGDAFQKAACVVAQMITKMHHDNGFWYDPTGGGNYDQEITPAPGRKIISISGTADDIVPYLGGTSVVGTRFLDCQESIYRFAQAMGETGPQIADAEGIPGNLTDEDPTNDYSPQFVKYSYLEGEVIHYKLIGGNHWLIVDPDNPMIFLEEALSLVADFLLE